MDELTTEFVAETRETLEAIGEALLAWEAQPEDTSRLDEVFRFVHTVKGSCGFLDLPRIAALAHAAETVLALARSGQRSPDAALVGAMLRLIDRIAALADALDPDCASPQVADDDVDLIAALDERAAPARTPVPAEALQPIRSVRINVTLLEALMTQVSDLVLVRNDLARVLRGQDEQTALQAPFDRLTAIVGELRDSVTRTRMQPIDRLFAALPRLVRDTAAAVGKTVELEIHGHDVEIDREMIEAIRDPLIHIVRNAIDHGIEFPEARIAAGKPGAGRLAIIAQQSGNQVSIEVVDDGRGIDTARVVEKAVAARLIEAGRAALLDDDAASQLIFEPGLSTASAVTSVSGRGVGMDVVRANVERLGGAVSLSNRPGQGLAITIRAPLTLSIVTALIVTSGDRRFAIPRGAIEEVVTLRSGKSRLDRVGGALVAVVRGESLPAFSLSSALDLAASEPRLAIVLLAPGGRRYALAVDSVSDTEELVVRPMAPRLAGVGVFAGQSLADDGRPIVVLDPHGLAVRGGLDRSTVVKPPVAPSVPDVVRSMLLVTLLDGRQAAVRSSVVDRILDVATDSFIAVGTHDFVIIDNVHVEAIRFGPLGDGPSVTTLRLSDHQRTVALPVAFVHDLVPIPALTPVGDEWVEGLAIVDGVSVLVLDGGALLSSAAVPDRERPIALVTLARSAWALNILTPLIEAAGYQVRFGATADDATVVVHLEGEAVSVGGNVERFALPRSIDADAALSRDDRDALTATLARAGSARR